MLDEVKKIQSESDYSLVYQDLTMKQLPTYLMNSLMQIFEEYRNNKKIGWVRPWNKQNLCVFQSLRWYPNIDKDISSLLRIILLQNSHYFDDNSEYFVREILSDFGTQGYLFFHDHCENEIIYEGITLSFGRFSSINSRYRDRIDIILESNIFNSISSQNVDKIRIYIDPHTGDTRLPQALKLDKTHHKSYYQLKKMYDLLIKKYHLWKNTEREWYHWSQKFVSYFGERKNIPSNTLFFTQKQNLHFLKKEDQPKVT